VTIEVVSHVELPIVVEDDVMRVRHRVRELAMKQKLDSFAVAAVTTAASELTRNVWVHAGRGRVLIEELTDGQRFGVRLEFRDVAELDRAASLLDNGSRDEQGLALEVPSDGLHSLRTLLDGLDAESIEVDGLSVRSADLDDVFLSLTGRRDGQEVPSR